MGSRKEQERIQEILKRLDQVYGTESKTYLEHENAWQLLVATILSAQCTDARVNLVTKDLFRKYDSLEKLAAARQEELEQDIFTTGFYHNKAKNIIACAKALLERHGGEVPSDMESLTALPGDRQCGTGEYFRHPQRGGGHPCGAYRQAAGADPESRSGEGRV